MAVLCCMPCQNRFALCRADDSLFEVEVGYFYRQPKHIIVRSWKFIALRKKLKWSLEKVLSVSPVFSLTVNSLQSPYKKLNEALSSVEAFEKHYLVSAMLIRRIMV